MADAFNGPGAVKPFGVLSSAAWPPEGRMRLVSGHLSQEAAGDTVGKGDMCAQTRQRLVNIRNVLKAAGGTMNDMAKVTPCVRDVSRTRDVHEVWSGFFKRPYPAEAGIVSHASGTRTGLLR
jgi:2-iminobutanoate/2-iminopropanoate deaminase